MEYAIDDTRIRKQIHNIEKAKSKDKKTDIQLLKILIGENEIAPCFNYNRRPINKLYYYLLELIQKYEIQTYNNIIDASKYNYQYNDLTQDDIVTLVHDFYKTRSKSIFLKFLECFDKRKTNLQFVKAGSLDNNPGLSFLINTIKESYILCEYTGTIYDVTKLAHEYGHATMFLYDKNMYEDKNIVYTELDGIYFELEMMKYLYKNNILKEDVSLAALVEHNYMHDASAYLSYNLDLNGLVYLLSHMISIEICTRNDKDELFEKIVTYKPKSIMDSINFIEKYIILNEHLQEYHSKVIKRANKYVLSKK